MDFEKIIALLGEHPIYNTSMFILALAGPLYAIISDIVGKRKKSPTYWIGTTQLLRETFDKNTKGKITITYGDKKIPNLSLTHFVFWNRGKDAIRKTDLPSKMPLTVSIDDKYNILDAYIEKQSREDNNFSIQMAKDGKSVQISFEYIEYNQGGVIKIVHDAPDSSAFTVSGKVISGDPIQRKGLYGTNFLVQSILKLLFRLKMRERTFILRWTFIIFGALMIALPLLSVIFHSDSQDSVPLASYILFPLLGFAYVSLGLSQKTYIPKNLMEK